MKKYKYVEGSWGKKRIYYNFFQSQKTANYLLIIFHGSFGSSLTGKKEKYIIKYLLEKGVDVFVFETSRIVQSWEFKGSFENYKKEFAGKTFLHEKEDVVRMFNFIKNNILNKDEKRKMYFIGSSLGATLCSYLLPKNLKLIEGVLLVNPAVVLKNKTSTFSRFPKKQEILNNFKLYKGKIALIEGENDVVVSQKDANKILISAKNAQITMHVRIKGVEHSFRNFNGKPAIKKLSIILSKIIWFLMQ